MYKILANKYIIIAVVVLGILASVYFVGKSAGKIKTPKHKKLPNGGSGISAGFEPSVIGKELFNVLDGIFTTSITKEIVLSKLEYLSDDEITAVYNWFNTEYAHKDDGTLYEWIESEWNISSGIKNEVLSRLKRLKLV